MELNTILIFSVLFLCVFGEKTFGDKYHEATIEPKNEAVTDSSSILFFHYMGSTSHLHFMRPLAERLAEIGHNVTFVQYAPSKFRHENFRQILIDDRAAATNHITQAMAFGLGDISFSEKINFYKYLYKTIKDEMFPMCAQTILESPELMQIIRDKPKFNAVATMWKCGAALAHILDAPLIWLSPASPEAFPHQMESLGIKWNPNIQPAALSKFVEPMSLFDRFTNNFIAMAWSLWWNYVDVNTAKVFRDLIDKDLPDIDLIAKERSVYLISNSHISTHGSWAYHQNVENVGGIHCRPGKQLPTELNEYMDSHPEGVVYVSFGSLFKASAMMPEKKTIFYETFKELNVPIIWKWDDDNINGIPENVRVSKWLPQNDLLAHPNLKAFVTHGGLLSIQEAIYHKTTLVGIPLSSDQGGNIARAESNGFAILIDFKTMTKDKLLSAIRKALSDETMRTSIEKMNRLFTSGESPLNRAVNAVERVLKDPTSLQMIKPHSVMNMPWYQYFGIDIAFFISLISLMICFIVWKTCLLCCLNKTKMKTEMEYKDGIKNEIHKNGIHIGIKNKRKTKKA